MVILPLLFALFVFYFASKSRSDVAANWVLGASAVLVAWSVSVTIAARIFLHEKVEDALASVLASPISVAELFIGKAVAAFLLSYMALLIAVIATVCALSISAGTLPDVCTFTMALLAMPACSLAVIEVTGGLCFLMGRSDLVIYIGMYVGFGPSLCIGGLRTTTSNVWVFLAVTVVGLAAAAVIAVLFSKVSKTRLAR